MSEQEMLDYLLSTGLYEVTDEKRPYNDLFYEYRNYAGYNYCWFINFLFHHLPL